MFSVFESMRRQCRTTRHRLVSQSVLHPPRHPPPPPPPVEEEEKVVEEEEKEPSSSSSSEEEEEEEEEKVAFYSLTHTHTPPALPCCPLARLPAPLWASPFVLSVQQPDDSWNRLVIPRCYALCLQDAYQPLPRGMPAIEGDDLLLNLRARRLYRHVLDEVYIRNNAPEGVKEVPHPLVVVPPPGAGWRISATLCRVRGVDIGAREPAIGWDNLPPAMIALMDLYEGTELKYPPRSITHRPPHEWLQLLRLLLEHRQYAHPLLRLGTYLCHMVYPEVAVAAGVNDVEWDERGHLKIPPGDRHCVPLLELHNHIDHALAFPRSVIIPPLPLLLPWTVSEVRARLHQFPGAQGLEHTKGYTVPYALARSPPRLQTGDPVWQILTHHWPRNQLKAVRTELRHSVLVWWLRLHLLRFTCPVAYIPVRDVVRFVLIRDPRHVVLLRVGASLVSHWGDHPLS